MSSTSHQLASAGGTWSVANLFVDGALLVAQHTGVFEGLVENPLSGLRGRHRARLARATDRT